MMNHLIPLALILAAYAASNNAHGAVVMTPAVEGLSGGTFKPLSMPSLTGGNFAGTGKVLINGRFVNIPGYIPPAGTAAAAARSSMWLNPWLTGFSLLAWADEVGIGSDQVGGWKVAYAPETSEPTGTVPTNLIAFGIISAGGRTCETWGRSTGSSACGAIGGTYQTFSGNCTVTAAQCTAAGYTSGCYDNIQLAPGSCQAQVPQCPSGYVASGSSCTLSDPASAATVDRPATEADFQALPDPQPEVLAELAPQVGVPVGDPVYEPVTVPVGDPYTKPDGSTSQPMARISPASGGQVTVDTFDMPVTDPAGDPVVDPVPEDTPEETPPSPTQCDKYPQTLGCALLDQPDADLLDEEQRDIALIAPVSVGGAGSCPAPLTTTVLGQVVEMSFDPLCQFANTLRPLVLSLAWLSAGFIFIGGVKNG